MEPTSGRMLGSATAGIVEGQPLPSAFALFLVQVIIIISLSKLVNYFLAKVRRQLCAGALPVSSYDELTPTPCLQLKQPAVVGEMLAGIILGP
jgi:Kef-type K+ transport system membrane component KefB